jgi:hypothetical protein
MHYDKLIDYQSVSLDPHNGDLRAPQDEVAFSVGETIFVDAFGRPIILPESQLATNS